MQQHHKQLKLFIFKKQNWCYFFNSKNIKNWTTRTLLILSDVIDLRRFSKRVSLCILSIYYSCKNKEECKDAKSKVVTLLWDEEFKLADVPYPILNIKSINTIQQSKLK